ARIGLAHGSFRALRFANDTSDHVAVHMSQFLGTGIVRAYKTERCGLSGLRILLHPNLEPFVDRINNRIVSVADDAARSPHVVSEVNYLELNPSDSGPDYDDVLVFDSLRNM